MCVSVYLINRDTSEGPLPRLPWQNHPDRSMNQPQKRPTIGRDVFREIFWAYFELVSRCCHMIVNIF